MLESGKLVHKIGFDIDSKSWRNLKNFQNRISMLKQQMKGLNGAVDFKVNASGFRQQATKVAKIQAEATRKVQSSSSGKFAHGRDKTYSNWWTDALKTQDADAKRYDKYWDDLSKGNMSGKSGKTIKHKKVVDEQAKIQAADEKRYNKYWDNLSKADTKGFSKRTIKHKKAIDHQAIANKREVRIANMRNRLDYQMKKGGVGIQSSTAFMNGGFAKAAEGFRKTGDISAFSQQVSLASRKMIDSAKSAKTMGRSLHDMRGMIVAATAAYTAFSVVQNVASTGMQLESLKAGMKVFAGSDTKVRSEFDYIVAQSERMGVNFEAAASQYTKFNIVARNKLSSEQRKEMFEGMSEYATVLQVDPEQYKRAFTAINQMMSKGTVQSEELKGQLSEALFGSTELLAKAMGVTEKELFKQMEAGKVMAAEVLPKLAKEYRKAAMGNGAFDAASKKTRAELNRFMTQLSLFKNEIFEGGFGEGLSGFFKMTSTLLKDIKPLANFIGKVLKWAFLGLAQALNIVAAPLRLASNLFSLLDDNAKAFVAGGSILAAAGAWIYLSKAIRGVTIAQIGLLKSSKLLASVPWIAAGLVAEDVTATVMSGGKANSITKNVIENVYGSGNVTKGLSTLLKPMGIGNFAIDSLVNSANKAFNSTQQNKVEVKIDATGLNDKQIDYRVNQQMGNAITDIAGESGN